MREVSEQDKQSIVADFKALVNQHLAESTSGTDFQEKVEKTSYKTNVAHQDDGLALTDDSDEVSESSPQQPNQSAGNLYQFPTGTAREEVLRDMKQNKAYFETTADKKPATQQDIQNAIPDINLEEISRNLCREYDKIIEKETPDFKAKRQKAIESKKTEWVSDRIAYVPNTYESNGEPKSFKMAVQRVNWGDILAKEATSPEDAIERLRSFITFNIKKHYGGWSRIQTIVVRDQQLIINDVCYMPSIEKEHFDANIFPLDTVDYIRNGCMAQFFNWKVLKAMNHLYLIDIDDANFFTMNIGDDLGLGRRIGVSSLFNIIPSLNELIIGGESITADSLHTEESVPIKQKIATSKRFITFSDNYKVNVFGITNGIQNYTFTNLKNYANNRGNKGLFRFCCGTVARAGLTTVAGALNLGVHMISAGIQVLKQGFTPVTENEIYNNPQ